LALSLRWPGVRFLPRGLGAVVGAFLGTALLFWVRPGDWAVVDWAVRSRMEAAFAALLQVIRDNLGPEGIPEGLEAQAMWTIALLRLIFPAFLGLASLSALGFAWWLHKRLGRNPEEGIGPLREFRFNDQLIWVLILGILALLASSGVLERIGANAVVFMGALYALRGAAVVLFLTGGISFFGGVLLLVGFLFVAHFVILGAVFFGLGDTWFDLRARRGSTRSGA
ncbi:MAG: YybS family protein, partial [Longimicrobiales bacterium]|nr:YybS family protein [Longimicrobiales bacterium]